MVYIMKKITVALIWPRGEAMPLGFGYLVSNASDRGDCEIRIVDCNIEDIDENSPQFMDLLNSIAPDVIGFFSYSSNFSLVLEMIKNVRREYPESVVIIGGPHATISAETIIMQREVDFVFRGEAELSFPVFIDKLLNKDTDFSDVDGLVYKDSAGKPAFNEIALVSDLDDIKIPDYGAINLNRYLDEEKYLYAKKGERWAPIYVTRGCPYKCEFCSASFITSKKVRKHSVEYVVDWLKHLYHEFDIRGFNIIDDNFTFHRNFAKEFCRQVIMLGYDDVEFDSPNGIRMQRGNPELWHLMRKAGWRTVVVAPESGSDEMLKRMRKDLDINVAKRIIGEIKASGLNVHGFFMVGYPGETQETLDETLAFIKESGFHDISVTVFQPLPGTPIFQKLIENQQLDKGFQLSQFGCEEVVYHDDSLNGFDIKEFRYNARQHTLIKMMSS